MSKISVLGIDLAKNVFQLHETDEKGKIILQKRLSRNKLAEFICNTPYARAVKEVQPAICIGENVRGLVNHDNGQTIQAMKDVLTELGYTVLEPADLFKARVCNLTQKQAGYMTAIFFKYSTFLPCNTEWSIYDGASENT